MNGINLSPSHLWAVADAGKIVRVGWVARDGDVMNPSRDGADMLARYFQKKLPQPAFTSFNPAGTPFQRKVWAAICEIPFGHVMTYSDIARAVGSHPRAVGGAVGANPIPILIPCHRVMGADGSLTGFSAPGGVDTKKWLLRHEGIAWRE